jgi:hypothetical protein
VISPQYAPDAVKRWLITLPPLVIRRSTHFGIRAWSPQSVAVAALGEPIRRRYATSSTTVTMGIRKPASLLLMFLLEKVRLP